MSIFFLLQMGKDYSEWRSRPQFNFKCQDLSLILLWLINMLVNCWLVANELIYKLREDLTINVEVTSKIVKCCWTDSCVLFSMGDIEGCGNCQGVIMFSKRQEGTNWTLLGQFTTAYEVATCSIRRKPLSGAIVPMFFFVGELKQLRLHFGPFFVLWAQWKLSALTTLAGFFCISLILCFSLVFGNLSQHLGQAQRWWPSRW